MDGTRISELKEKSISLKAILQRREEVLRDLSEKIGKMNSEMNEYQQDYEKNQRELPLIKEKLAKKEKIIEQEKHDEGIIQEKIAELYRLKGKLLAERHKIELKFQNMPTPPRQYEMKKDTSSPGSQQIAQKENQIQQHQDIHQQQQQQHEDKIITKINDSSSSSNNNTVNSQNSNNNASSEVGQKQKNDLEPTQQEKASVAAIEKVASTEEDNEDEKSDEDCDDILERIKSNLQNADQPTHPEQQDDDDGEEKE